MKIIPAVLLFGFFAGVWLALHACTLLTIPMTTAAIGGAQLAIKGAELQKEIRKADAQEALDASFENTWDMSVTALMNLHIEIVRIEKTKEGDGGSIEGLAKKIKIKVVAVKLTEKITEIGIWTGHDKALAGLIAEKIKEGAQNPKAVIESRLFYSLLPQAIPRGGLRKIKTPKRIAYYTARPRLASPLHGFSNLRCLVSQSFAAGAIFDE